MATKYISPSGNDSSGDGSSGNPWKTFSKANSAISNGDTVIVKNGTYNESVKITKANSTWQAETKHQAIVDGRYPPSLLTNRLPHVSASNQYLPGTTYGELVTIAANGVTVDGLYVRNVAGEGIGGAVTNNVTITNCKVDWTYGSGINFAGKRGNQGSNLEISYCEVTRTSVKIYDPDRTGGDGQKVAGGYKVEEYDGVHIHHCTGAYGHGEMCNPGKFNRNAIVEYCTFHTANHACINANRSDNTILRYNLLYHTLDPEFRRSSDGNVAPGITWGDEHSKGDPFHSSGGAIYGNIIVGTGRGIEYRNGGQYNTQLIDHYCGYNTIILRKAAYGTPLEGIEIADNRQGRNHQRTLIENNIVLVETGVPGTVCKITGNLNGITFRNNCWSAQPGAAARGNGDQYGDPKVFNPFPNISGSVSSNPATNINTNNYKLTSASTLCINKASNGSTINGVTPPASTVDYFGASRPVGAAKDIGAHEFGGSVSTLIAAFTQNSGTAALTIEEGDSVSFADTSTGSPSTWEWDFGDGMTSTAENPSHTYNTAGTYIVTLRVMDDSGLQSTATGNAITVTTTGGGHNVLIDVFRQALATSTGNQDWTSSLGGEVPKAALYFGSLGTSDGALADGVGFFVGAAVDENQQWAHAFATTHNVTTTNAGRRRVTNGCMLMVDGDGEVTGKARHVSFAANKHTVNVSDAFPVAGLTTGLHFTGSGTQAAASTVALGAAENPVTVNIGFKFDVLFVFTAGGSNDAAGNHLMLSMGMALNDGTQYRLPWFVESGVGTNAPRITPSNERAGLLRGGDVIGAVRTGILVDNITGTSFDFIPTLNGAQTSVSFLALKLDGVSVWLGDVSTPTSTGSVDYQGPEFQVGTLVQFVSQIIDIMTSPDDHKSGAIGVHAADSGGEFTVMVSSEYGVTTTNDQSISDDRFLITDDDGAAVVAGATTLASDGWAINYTAAGSEAFRQIALAIGVGSTTALPVARFTASDTSGYASHIVNFTSLSDGNGNTITAYAWDFGDGGTSTSANPSYTYEQPGRYTVSLTVTTSAGSHTETKADYINVLDPANRPHRLLLHRPMTITNDTVNELHGTDEDDPLYGFMEFKIDLNALYLPIVNEAQPQHKQGKMHLDWINNRNGNKYLGAYVPGAQENITPFFPFQQFYYDSANGRFLFQLRNGNWRAISTSAVDVGGDPGDVGEGSVIAQIANGLHDGREVSGVVELSNSSAINISAQQRYAILYFPSITIPIGATITRAKLDLYLYAANLSSPNGIQIWADDSDSAAAPAETSNNISSRTATSAVVTWNGTGLGKGTHSTPDFKSVVQEVSDRGGRSATFNFAVIMRGTSSTNFTFWPYERGASDAATLRIDYTT